MTHRSLNALLQTKSKASDERYTPPHIIRSLGHFELDPACGDLCPHRTAHRRYSSDGLKRPWRGRVWLNPPFSNARPWIDRFMDHGDGIALVFARTDAVWFQAAVDACGGCFLLKGRIQFECPNGGRVGHCPIGCALLPIGEHNHAAIRQSGLEGIFLHS